MTNIFNHPDHCRNCGGLLDDSAEKENRDVCIDCVRSVQMSFFDGKAEIAIFIEMFGHLYEEDDEEKFFENLQPEHIRLKDGALEVYDPEKVLGVRSSADDWVCLCKDWETKKLWADYEY